MKKTIVFKRDNFIIFEAKGGYVVYNKTKTFDKSHTHINSLNVGISMVKNILNRVTPKTSNIRILESYLRVSHDKDYNKIIQNKIDCLKVKEYYKNKDIDVEIFEP